MLIPLSSGKFTIIDKEDYNKVSQYKWCYSGCHNGYAIRGVRQGKRTKRIYLHRFILNAPEGKEVDHINGNRLDNQKHNLRLCSRLENARNLKKFRNNTSGFKGVHKNKNTGKYEAYIHNNSKKIFLGHFSNKSDAVNARNKASDNIFGDFTRLGV